MEWKGWNSELLLLALFGGGDGFHCSRVRIHLATQLSLLMSPQGLGGGVCCLKHFRFLSVKSAVLMKETEECQWCGMFL